MEPSTPSTPSEDTAARSPGTGAEQQTTEDAPSPTSRWAKNALYFALVGLVLVAILFLCVVAGITPPPTDTIDPVVTVLALLPSLAMLIALICAAVGTVEITVRRTNVTGWRYIIKSLVVIMLYLGFIFYTLVRTTGEREAMTMRGVVESGSVEQVASLLAEKPTMVDRRYHREQTPLARVISTTGDMDMIELLISKGANVNADCGGGLTPLHFAVWHAGMSSSDPTINAGIDYKAVIECLLQNGADANSRTNSGETPLGVAINENCNDEVIELLRKHGGTE